LNKHIITKTAQEHYNSGLANEDSQHFESAIEDYTEAIKLDTEYSVQKHFPMLFNYLPAKIIRII
jgi:hypothetical protein